MTIIPCSRCLKDIHALRWPVVYSRHGATLCWRCTEILGIEGARAFKPILSPKAEQGYGVLVRVAIGLLLAFLLGLLAYLKGEA